ncbi:HXXEE domain-containing protein [Paucilactobacillus suebicus]|uniref:HXXEE domain-containing protein n=1 Tax=Paucilactobacillus suebicus DSM 5007 = KCTC 3549 TaxID=1423807 RepID=A0A0R1W084_9LACO|nr:HXXEE domain-containing protein [Paucilactobacillus suebicus]KRM11162.1 hypothetical protein FD16_GL000978 [Paucilactobacillus suebicus DSM 5007 = KCTC 3549]
MKYFIRHWYEMAVFVAGLIAVIITLGHWNFLQVTILGSLLVIHLHFFEEMGFPGGFPWVGINVELHIDERDSTKWDLNQLSTLWGNEWFAGLVYVVPLIFPQWHWLSLSAVIFAFAELAMHLIYFPLSIKKIYNPGFLTAVFGLTPISINYIVRTPMTSTYHGIDWLLVIVWIIFNYWMAFRGPVYKKFGSMKQYSFTDEEVSRAMPYMKKVKENHAD